jgi:DNA-binding NtrC family response regulator
MLTGDADVSSVVQAMRLGASDYVTKPFRMQALADTVQRTLDGRELGARYGAAHDDALDDPDELETIVGASPALMRAKSLLRRIATSPASTVLITGESGTGKDLAAKAVHACSHRAGGPFVNVTCSALPSNLLESELFGHERGAFTDAKTRKLGLVEQANGGTLFLDEMGEMEPGLQAKLLRFLEDKAFRRVGGTQDIRSDARVIAATNVDLPAAVAQKRFREDLYYRLAVLTVSLPPLRERPGDVPRLARHFLATFAERFGKPLHDITPRAMQLLEQHAWPGNIRELKNTLERATLLAHGEVLDRQDLELTPSASASQSSSTLELPPSGLDLRELERTLVSQALRRCRGNVTRAGRLLGLNRDQVRYRVDKFGLRGELTAQRSA